MAQGTSDGDLAALLNPRSPSPQEVVVPAVVPTPSPTPLPTPVNDDQATFPEILGGAMAPTEPSSLAKRYLSPEGDSLRLKFRGVATTAYTAQPISSFGAVSFGCGMGYVSSNFTSAYVGVGRAMFNMGFSCGQCIRLQCDDESCKHVGKKVDAQIIDSCGNCPGADISIANPLFQTLTGRLPSPKPNALISWEFIDCAPRLSGSIKMLVKPGGSIYYQAFNFANSIDVIRGVEMNGFLLDHGEDNYWAWNPRSPINPAGPFRLAILGSAGQVLRVELPVLRSLDLGVQFVRHN
ncbi:hypothetical protein H632_c498p0 [Helicosporidium sp. ATCC 50920]|nr:hypothetical protein H632_c498p0 [Helicosporidium sp. ATCC 50920]|eukprot:KDD75789.1 hypothetical protein H632_c498p0 [Helicosporidium sp. ATCC 50920]